MQLSEHFSFEEMIASEVAARKWIDNTPPVSLDLNLRHLCERLEDVRMLLGAPIFITSGYRSPDLNRAVGGQTNSAHLYGLAADFICPQFGPPRKVCKAIAESQICYEQLILEFGSWCHFAVETPGRVGRKELLTITHSGTRQGIG